MPDPNELEKAHAMLTGLGQSTRCVIIYWQEGRIEEFDLADPKGSIAEVQSAMPDSNELRTTLPRGRWRQLRNTPVRDKELMFVASCRRLATRHPKSLMSISPQAASGDRFGRNFWAMADPNELKAMENLARWRVVAGDHGARTVSRQSRSLARGGARMLRKSSTSSDEGADLGRRDSMDAAGKTTMGIDPSRRYCLCRGWLAYRSCRAV